MRVRERIGYLPESVPLYRDLTVSAYLDLVATLKGMPRGGRGPHIDGVVDACGLADVYRRRIGALSPRKLGELVKQAREYSFDFLRWKKAYVLREHYQVHTRTICPRDGQRLTYRKHLGLAGRRAFFCERCQRLYE